MLHNDESVRKLAKSGFAAIGCLWVIGAFLSMGVAAAIIYFLVKLAQSL